MTVRDLIDELKNYDEDLEVVFKGGIAMYVESIGTTGTNEVKPFYGKNWEAVVLYGNQQVGVV